MCLAVVCVEAGFSQIWSHIYIIHKIIVVVLLEYIDLLQLHKQSTVIIGWACAQPALSCGYTTALSDVDIIILKFYVYEEHLNSCRWWVWVSAIQEFSCTLVLAVDLRF